VSFLVLSLFWEHVNDDDDDDDDYGGGGDR
jgi:hypothetical protein